MKFKRQPFAKQLEALETSKDKPNFALFMEQGTGKTKVTLDTANYLYNQGVIDTLIVIAWPNGVHRNWVDIELAKDLTVPHLATFWQSSLTKAKQKQIENVYHYKDGLRVMTYNIEAVNTDKAKANIKHFLDSGKVMLVIDQSACIKTPNAARTKTMLKFSKHKNVMVRRILDGDPIAEGLHEIFTQFKFLDPEIIGLTSYTAFKSMYCEIGYFKNITGYKNVDTLMSKLEPYFFRCTAQECVDLPERIYKRWIFDLSSKERRLFNEMRDYNITMFNNGEEDIITQEKLALTKNMRLQQITSGWINHDKGKKETSTGKFVNDYELIPIDKEPSRYKAFKELIESVTGKMIIFARFVKDIQLLESLLGKQAVSYHGGVSEDDKAEAKRSFMEDEETRFFIGQPSSAGIGHTLTAAKHIVFYSNSHSLRLRKECEKRAHRTGLKHHLLIWDLIANDTQDANIVKCLIDKKKVSDAILKEPESFFLKEID